MTHGKLSLHLRGRVTAALLACLAALFLASCKGEPPSAETVRQIIEREVPGAQLRRTSHVHLGRFTLGLVKGVMRLVAFDDAETRRTLSHVQRVDIADYEILSMPEADFELTDSFHGKLERHGWYPMVKVREEDSRTWIYYREDGVGSISNLYIVELDSTELVVIDLAGRLDRLTAELIADDPDAFMAGIGS